MRRLLITGLLFAMAHALAAQTADDSTLHVASRLVVVPALVQTASKDVAYSLRAEDFQLSDRGILQSLTLDDAKDRPSLSLS